MKKNRKTYILSQKASALFMIFALVWLTISTPFVISFEQQMAKKAKTENNSKPPVSDTEEETCKTPGNNTEEKTPADTSLSEDYLHDYPATDYFISGSAQFHKSKNSEAYIAFHCELFVPPPITT
jgi:hypothetical protein